jgi:hypothetical protein
MHGRELARHHILESCTIHGSRRRLKLIVAA